MINFGKYLSGNQLGYLYDIYKNGFGTYELKSEHEETTEMVEAKRKRIERKQKLKKQSLDNDELSTEDFLEMGKKLFVETDLVSDLVYGFFEEEIHILDQIKILNKEYDDLTKQRNELNDLKDKLNYNMAKVSDKINDLKIVLKDDEIGDKIEDDWFDI